jgi:hypothetical protein
LLHWTNAFASFWKKKTTEDLFLGACTQSSKVGSADFRVSIASVELTLLLLFLENEKAIDELAPERTLQRL